MSEVYKPKPEIQAIMDKYSKNSSKSYQERMNLAQIEMIEFYLPDMDSKTKKRAKNTLKMLRTFR